MEVHQDGSGGANPDLLRCGLNLAVRGSAASRGANNLLFGHVGHGAVNLPTPPSMLWVANMEVMGSGQGAVLELAHGRLGRQFETVGPNIILLIDVMLHPGDTNPTLPRRLTPPPRLTGRSPPVEVDIRGFTASRRRTSWMALCTALGIRGNGKAKRNTLAYAWPLLVLFRIETREDLLTASEPSPVWRHFSRSLSSTPPPATSCFARCAPPATRFAPSPCSR